ncbi:sensor domain-containing diguanylate cyclase [Hungatella hominis]|uniref:GGDEF domain-containing protein n=1 Tax=Hungatella hominis TaxID=2763050 RepID=A0ABR7HCE7_9FIRM|nr:sensor domain-containing diguanylate cyclase [Hungatella hominis]MBC5710860.1 GGDEF domain-containing protein [Hungatella hominis]
MEKNRELLKTNLLVSVILVCGFLVTAFFSYQANYEASLNNIEQVASLTTEGIYYQLTALFTRPVNISLTMAHDSLLAAHLEGEEAHLEDEQYAWTIKNYLETYREKYDFDSVFLVSALTNRYYNFNGIDRILTEGDPENVWYFDMLKDDLEYSMNVDNDEVNGADNAITVFVNCKIYGPDRDFLGVVGVGMRVSYLKEFLKSYEEKYHLNACLIDENGVIEISSEHTGYSRIDWFQTFEQESIRSQVLGWKEDSANLELWSDTAVGGQGRSYVVSRYIPELSWHLVVEQNNGAIVSEIKDRLYQTGVIIIAIIITVLVVITTVLRNFNRQITQLMEERQDAFKRATEQLYDNIYELNITRNRYANKLTEQYFGSLGAGDLPYDQGLKVIAEKQIKEEYREGYVSTFTPENVIRQYEMGNNHLRYDFKITQDGSRYFWMRIDAYIFFSQEDECIHMFTYRKNINAEKEKEIRASFDEMTGFLTKMETEREITALLSKPAAEVYAFFLFDVDNFKQANDSCGHAFGDYCIREFTSIIRTHFRVNDVLGRVGGDEFAAFIPAPDSEWVEDKAKELSNALRVTCTEGGKSWEMSASIGVSIAPIDGNDFDTLYQKADAALYQTKQRGKNGYTIA